MILTSGSKVKIIDRIFQFVNQTGLRTGVDRGLQYTRLNHCIVDCEVEHTSFLTPPNLIVHEEAVQNGPRRQFIRLVFFSKMQEFK